ncbi:S-adenosylmethionine-dependent methyltransferase [Lachancea thermotolerans CBS 6340]|uniref:peptide chain release factor N(5)-glutamine methyltransferase n=1 Tax=Lachancea thermotolerans (strain ATCC 56472 / CBS 6340 / NRRL Y-8284) TaxID=559295 RepID=C5DMJ3_LACTC|nr:KLTH0G09416p [Lachancea thermotolerans CBS 6340]CAR25004.1 KLTH0G09416p [Lachancea thermotolerans CBS 6340]
MVRIKPSVLKKACQINPLLPLLLPECRTIEAAQQELRWIQNEVSDKKRVRQCCMLRARHYPLQYLLGSQPFGPLDVTCQPGVLIPRWETEEWTVSLAEKLPRDMAFDIMDLCTGTGCIPLLLKQMCPKCSVFAVDRSPLAYKLATRNSNTLQVPLKIIKKDILERSSEIVPRTVDLITCNPPYIPRTTFARETARSVKLFEPKLALLGNKEFYANLVDCWMSRTDAFVYEVGDLSQCYYVLNRVTGDVDLSRKWRIGFRHDSCGRPRIVYGFRASGSRLNWASILVKFGDMKH